MRTINRIGRLVGVGMGLLVPTLFLSGCGGGGSSVPSSLTGTYSGRYSFPAQSVGGNMVMRVQTDGKATGIFDEGTSAEFPLSGSVNSEGRISLKATITRNSRTAKVTLTGDASSSRASGDIVLDLPNERDSGSFSLVKTSSSLAASALQSENLQAEGTIRTLGKKLGVDSTEDTQPR